MEYTTVPPLPLTYVERPLDLAQLRDALLRRDKKSMNITALHGMGGIGKTKLAQGIAHDNSIQQAFPDGII